ncbi:MAG: ParB/RepB/Spo0J family partition protein [Ferrovibrio sp.]|nr:ParB/RepB/Spo0J family partition protein [Ferrovibrio sp.]
MIDDPKKRPADAAGAAKRGLGRGLAALMGDGGATGAPTDAAPRGGLRELPIEQLMPNPYQPRQTFNAEALASLAASIRERGVLQPLVVRRSTTKAGMFEIIAGERRWRASQMAQLHHVPAVVKEIDDRQALEIGIIENVQRQDLNAMEEAQAYRRLTDEFGYSAEAIADAIGKSRPHVANTLRLLALPESAIRLIIDGRLTAGQARPLIGHPQAAELALQIAEGKLTARQAESMAKIGKAVSGTAAAPKPPKAGGGSSSSSPTTPKKKDADTLAFERSLSQALGLVVEVEVGDDSESGRLIINYRRLEQLDDLAKKLSRR